tara:strand:- start:231 stop:902 length:672 start_codon:yes stop_codon:yes gene_type:complete
MSKARKQATAMAVSYIEKILPKSGNSEQLQNRLEGMSDKQFGVFMKDLQDGVTTLQIKAPNLAKSKLSVSRNIKLGKELGYEFFQHLNLKDPATGQQYTTPHKYLILSLPFRRQAQHLVKKMSVPADNESRDDLTGQPTGKSKGSSLSNPEMQVLYAQGLDKTIEELIKVRGGNEAAYTAMNKAAHETGGFSLEQVSKAGGNVKATDSLAAFMKGMMISPLNL